MMPDICCRHLNTIALKFTIFLAGKQIYQYKCRKQIRFTIDYRQNMCKPMAVTSEKINSIPNVQGACCSAASHAV